MISNRVVPGRIDADAVLMESPFLSDRLGPRQLARAARRLTRGMVIKCPAACRNYLEDVPAA